MSEWRFLIWASPRFPGNSELIGPFVWFYVKHNLNSKFDSPNLISSKPRIPLFNLALISLPSSLAWGQWRGGGGPSSCSLLLLLTCPHTWFCSQNVGMGEEGGVGWEGMRSQHSSDVAETFLWTLGPGKWLKVKSLLSQQILSCLFPKWGSSTVSQRFPCGDTSSRKFSWFWTPSKVTLHPAVTPASFCWWFSHHHIGLKMKFLPSGPQQDRKHPAMRSGERWVLS